MKKKTKILLGVLLVLVVGAGALLFWQRNNITALKLSAQTSPDELLSQMEDGRKQVEDAAKEVVKLPVRDLNDEERQALRDQSLTRDEIIDLLLSGDEEPAATQEPEPESTASPAEAPASPAESQLPTASVPPVETATPAVTPRPTAKPAADPNREKLARCIAELYVMQEEYTTWLEEADRAAIDEYNALPPEKHTASNKYKIGMKYMDLALEKEKECDGRIAKLESEIRSLLTALGESTDLVDQIHAAYLNEKALKKAYYLGLH